MKYTLYMSGKTGQYYLIEDEQNNPNYWFEDACLNPFSNLYNKREVIYKHLTGDQFDSIVQKYNLGDNWYPGDYDMFETAENLINN